MNRLHSRSTRKILSGFMIIFAVVILSLIAHTLAERQKQAAAVTADSAPTTIAGSAPATSPTTTKPYTNGTYTANADYATPGGNESIAVTLTITGNNITASSLTLQANNRETEEYQAMFEKGYKTQVIGKPISSIHLSRVSGSSLTSSGFNQALEQIKQQAQN